MSSTEPVPAAAFVADDKDLVAVQLASTVWWNGHQQLPLNSFNCDYPMSYEPSSCDDLYGAFYNFPVADSSASHWPPLSTQTAAADDDDELMYSGTTPAGSATVDHPCKYQPTTHEYAMLECYSAIGDAGSHHTPWTVAPYQNSATSTRAAGYDVCCGGGGSAPMSAISVDYCNSLQLVPYSSVCCGGGGSGSLAIQFPSDVDRVSRQYGATVCRKSSST